MIFKLPRLPFLWLLCDSVLQHGEIKTSLRREMKRKGRLVRATGQAGSCVWLAERNNRGEAVYVQYSFCVVSLNLSRLLEDKNGS